MADNQWTSDRRLYLNAEGKVVEESDASRVSLLIAKGGTMALSLAEQYGLTGGEKAKAPAPNKALAPAQNKARSPGTGITPAGSATVTPLTGDEPQGENT